MVHPVDQPGAAARRARFEQVVRDVADPVLRFLLRRTDPDTAQDVLAETLSTCWRRLGDLPAEPLPWAYRVAGNHLANARRADRRRTQLWLRLRTLDPPAAADPPADPDTASEADARVASALTRLRPVDAEVLRLWAWEELEPAAIGEALGIGANAAAVRLHRARRRLRDELGKDPRGGGHRAGARSDRARG